MAKAKDPLSIKNILTEGRSRVESVIKLATKFKVVYDGKCFTVGDEKIKASWGGIKSVGYDLGYKKTNQEKFDQYFTIGDKKIKVSGGIKIVSHKKTNQKKFDQFEAALEATEALHIAIRSGNYDATGWQAALEKFNIDGAIYFKNIIDSNTEIVKFEGDINQPGIHKDEKSVQAQADQWIWVLPINQSFKQSALDKNSTAKERLEKAGYNLFQEEEEYRQITFTFNNSTTPLVNSKTKEIVEEAVQSQSIQKKEVMSVSAEMLNKDIESEKSVISNEQAKAIVRIICLLDAAGKESEAIEFCKMIKQGSEITLINEDALKVISQAVSLLMSKKDKGSEEALFSMIDEKQHEPIKSLVGANDYEHPGINPEVDEEYNEADVDTSDAYENNSTVSVLGLDEEILS